MQDALNGGDPTDLNRLPKLETKNKWTKKIKPGVSTFGDHPSDVGPEHLQELLDHALKYIPEDQIEDTPLFLMATAGVRLLEPVAQKGLLREICSYARDNTKFSLPDCDLHIQVIPGETEGLYGWIAANYLLGGFDNPQDHAHGQGHHTYGFLDMGGASAQIAFAPNTTESEKHAEDLKLLRMRTINGQPAEYKVFTTTWLGFGVNQARQRYVEALMDAHDVAELPDPCLPSGLKTTLKGAEVGPTTDVGEDPVLLGTGRFDECVKQTYPLLDKDAPCADQPCLLHGQHVPAIDFEVNHFVGVSEYFHTTELFEVSHKNKPYDFTTYQALVKDFCSEDWGDISEGVVAHKWGKKVDARTAQEFCFKASWLINVLHDGIGVPRLAIEKTHGAGFNTTKEVAAHAKDKGFLDPFQAVDKIDGVEVSWTLGKMVLYAAGQVPAATASALSVGFGSNIPGSVLPTDFQEAGSNSNPVPIGDDDGFVDTIENLAEEAQEHSRLSPSFLLFMIILIFIGYIFRKRERRYKLYKRVKNTWRGGRRPGSPRKGRSFFGGAKFFSRGSPASYSALEAGDAANEFELGSVDSESEEHSDSSERSRLGRSSGLATPKINVAPFESNSFYSDNPSQPVGLGLGNFPNAMSRSGLIVRTESRERLQTVGGSNRGGRSRAGSPTRNKSPLMTPLEED